MRSKDIKIGSLVLKSPWVLAPMAGITDAVMRELCEDMGAALTCTEMISAKGLHYNGAKTERLAYIPEGAGATSIQIFGSEPEIMAEAAEKLDGLCNAVLDINMGCPVPKVTKNGEGSALMTRPDLVYDIVRAVSKSSSKPVTAKIRKGFTEERINAVEVAKAVEEAGGAAIAVHGRTRTQYYSGSVDRNIIREVKEAVGIPVIASGDVTDAESGMSMMNETGCDMVMIGRGALGNPWIFRELNAAYKGEEIPERPNAAERAEMMIRHLYMLSDLKGEQTAVKEFRKFIGWYTKGLRGAVSLRRLANDITEIDSMINAIRRELQIG
ncbi:MAG: tRNA dihydrouridine synthase DusB [Mogibacterium sp.]|nr:tRNA dihydrouridine synthase DusB [Mogibacterium sp.]